MDGEAKEALEQEVELLEAVFASPDEMEIRWLGKDGVEMVLHLTPLTGGDKTNQFVTCDLILSTSSPYPNIPPEIRIGSSRGQEFACLTNTPSTWTVSQLAYNAVWTNRPM